MTLQNIICVMCNHVCHEVTILLNHVKLIKFSSTIQLAINIMSLNMEELTFSSNLVKEHKLIRLLRSSDPLPYSVVSISHGSGGQK